LLKNPIQLVRGLPPSVRLLITGTFINKLGTFVVPFLTIVLKREFGLTGVQIGLLVTAYGAGSIVSALSGGLLTDHLGRRVTLMTSLFGGGAIAVCLGVAPSIHVFVPLLLAFGFVADLYRPAASSIIGDLLPSSQRVIGFAAMRMVVNLGFCLGMALGGFIADWSWRALFVADGLTTLVYGVVVWLRIPETRSAALEGAAQSEQEGVSPWRDPVFLQLALVSFAFSLVFFCHVTVLPLTITLSAGYPAHTYGLIVGLNGLLIALLEISLVERLRRYRRLRLAGFGFLAAGLGFALTGLVMHWAWFVFTLLLWTAGEILSTPQKVAFVADWAPPAGRGRYLSLFQATWSLAVAVNPLLFLPIHAALPERLFWSLMLLIAAPATLLLFHLDRSADHPERLRGLSPAPPSEEELLAASPES